MIKNISPKIYFNEYLNDTLVYKYEICELQLDALGASNLLNKASSELLKLVGVEQKKIIYEFIHNGFKMRYSEDNMEVDNQASVLENYWIILKMLIFVM